MRTLILSAIGVLTLAAAPFTAIAQDAPAKAAVVHFSKLTPLLVDVAGWEAEKVNGTTAEAGGFKISTAERSYTKGEARVEISIMDYSESAVMMQGITAAWAFSSETTEGYAKSVTMDGTKGFETYTNEGKSGELLLVVGGRFILKINVNGMPAAEMQAWAKKIDLKKLAVVK